MSEARTPHKFTKSNAKDAHGKMTLEKVGFLLSLVLSPRT